MGVDFAHALTVDWLRASLVEKGCYAVVVAVGIASAIGTMRLARLLYAPLLPRRRLHELLVASLAPVEEIARRALAGRLLLDPPGLAADTGEAIRRVDPERLQAVRARVDELSREGDDRVAAVRGWLCIGLTVAALAAALAGAGPWEGDAVGVDAWTTAANASGAAIRLVVLLPWCLLTAACWTTLDAALRRRRTAWAYALAALAAER